MPSRRQSSEMFSSPRSPSSTMRTSLPPSTAGGADAKRSSAPALPVLYPARISVSSSLLAATMNQKSSLPEVPQLVSQVLTGDTLGLRHSGRRRRRPPPAAAVATQDQSGADPGPTDRRHPRGAV